MSIVIDFLNMVEGLAEAAAFRVGCEYCGFSFDSRAEECPRCGRGIELGYALKLYTDEMSEAMKTTTDIKRGERALGLWKELFAKEIPSDNGGYCHFCGAFSGDRIPKIHIPGCIYMDAMALVQDAERNE